MQVLCDVHVAYRLVNRLREIGVDATHVNRILEGSRTTDAAIAAYVDANKLLLTASKRIATSSYPAAGSVGRHLPSE